MEWPRSRFVLVAACLARLGKFASRLVQQHWQQQMEMYPVRAEKPAGTRNYNSQQRRVNSRRH